MFNCFFLKGPHWCSQKFTLSKAIIKEFCGFLMPLNPIKQGHAFGSIHVQDDSLPYCHHPVRVGGPKNLKHTLEKGTVIKLNP